MNGAELSRLYYTEVVAPLLAQHCPTPHAAGRLGSGSDVLGFDDEMSRDHDWGLRLNLLVEEEQVERARAALASHLPPSFRGHPTRFPTTWDPEEEVRVEVATAEGLVRFRLGRDVPRTPQDWLAVPGQSFLEITAGPLFHDDIGEMTRLREALAWYPDDVWRFVVARTLDTLRIDLPMLGRCGGRGDTLGTGVIAARAVETIVHLGFLAERQWRPYAKWLGAAYARLALAREVEPLLLATLQSPWPQSERSLQAAAEATYARLQEAGVATGESLWEPFYDRPYKTVSEPAIKAIRALITDAELRNG